jgi:hypothetical protein
MIKPESLKPIPKTGIPIDKSVPLPPEEVKREDKYPFKKMEVGDSFYAYGVTRGSLTSAAKYAGIKLGFTFICRAEGDRGARCWRTE